MGNAKMIRDRQILTLQASHARSDQKRVECDADKERESVLIEHNRVGKKKPRERHGHNQAWKMIMLQTGAFISDIRRQTLNALSEQPVDFSKKKANSY